MAAFIKPAGRWLANAGVRPFPVLRLMVKHSSFVRGIEDFLFWIFAGIVTFMLLYEQNDGGLRLYAIVGVLVGMSLYDRIVSRFLFAVLKKAGKWFKIKK